MGEGRQGVERQAEEQRERHPGAGVVDIVDIIDISIDIYLEQEPVHFRKRTEPKSIVTVVRWPAW